MNSTYTALWLVWLLMFAAIEGAALVRKAKGDTLTEHFRKWFSLKHKGKGWLARRGALLVFFLWAVYHFFVQ